MTSSPNQTSSEVSNLDCNQSSLFSLYIPVNNKWKKKYKKKYVESREKRLSMEDKPSLVPINIKSVYSFKPYQNPVISPDIEPYILSKAEYAEKNINDIQLKIERGGQLVSCVVGGISFYPIKKHLFRKFLRSVYFKYQWFYVAIPLDNESRLITSQTFAWFDAGWIPYSDKTLLSWMASEIGSSVVFTQEREMKLDPLPQAPDDPNSYYSSIQEKVSRVKKEYTKMDEAKYLNKNINDISFQFEESIQAGKLIFYRALISVRRSVVFTYYERFPDCHLVDKTGFPVDQNGDQIGFPVGKDELKVGFLVDNKGFPITYEVYIGDYLLFTKYDGNKEAIVRWFCHGIHPSVKFTELRKIKLEKLPPLPEDPDSYYVALQKKTTLRHREELNVLPKEAYLKKELNQISIQVDVGVPCKVGNLILYPRPKLTSVLINGSNLSPRFDGLYFAFQIRGPERFLVTDKCFINTDQGWKVYAKERKDFHEIILQLMKHAIDPSFPSPPIEDPISSDPDVLDSDSEVLCDAMIRLYREEYPSNARFYGKKGVIIRPLEVLVEELLSNQKIPQDRKYQSLKKFFGGYLPNTNWNALHSILAKYEVPQEICDEAKKTEVETAKAEAEFDQSPHE